ncbi:G-protein coupled acetylcholine receptor activity [Sparganum proliferum]
MPGCRNCSESPVTYYQIAISIANSAFGLLILVINSLILASFFSNKHARTLSNYFIASLALVDVLMGILPLNFFTANRLISIWPADSFVCDLWLFLDYSGCAIGQYAVLLITIDRYCSVKIPIAYNSWRTKARVFALIGASWIIPSVVFGFLIFGWPYSNSSTRKCYAKFSVHPVANTFVIVVYFWLTMSVIFCLLIAIYRVAFALRSRSGLRSQVVRRFWRGLDEVEDDASPKRSREAERVASSLEEKAEKGINEAPLSCSGLALMDYELRTLSIWTLPGDGYAATTATQHGVLLAPSRARNKFGSLSRHEAQAIGATSPEIACSVREHFRRYKIHTADRWVAFFS